MTTLQVAAEIRAELGRQNLSRAALARRMAVSEMWMSDRLTGKVVINIRDLYQFAEALEVHLFDLMPSWIVDSYAENRPHSRWHDRLRPSGRYARGPVRPRSKRPAGRPGLAVPPVRPGRTSRLSVPSG